MRGALLEAHRPSLGGLDADAIRGATAALTRLIMRTGLRGVRIHARRVTGRRGGEPVMCTTISYDDPLHMGRRTILDVECSASSAPGEGDDSLTGGVTIVRSATYEWEDAASALRRALTGESA